MKSVIVTLPAMGKTTLVKRYRDENWRDSLGVDFDLKGMNSYSDRVRAANTAYVSTVLSDNRHTFVTAFRGQVNVHDLLADGINVYFVVPYTKSAKRAAILRSYFRKDSRSFTELYASQIDVWVNDLIADYNEEACRSKGPGFGKCYLIPERSGKVLTQMFNCDPDTGDLLCKIALNNADTYFFNDAQPSACNLMDELFIPWACSVVYHGSHRPQVMFDNYFSSIYPENLHYAINPEEGMEYKTYIHIASEFDLMSEYGKWLQDPDIEIYQSSIDVKDHDCHRARINYSYFDVSEGRIHNVNEFHYVIGGTN